MEVAAEAGEVLLRLHGIDANPYRVSASMIGSPAVQCDALLVKHVHVHVDPLARHVERVVAEADWPRSRKDRGRAQR